MFRLAGSKDIDVIHRLLVSEARLRRFDQRLAQEPYSSALRKNLDHIRRKSRRLDQDLPAQLLIWEQDGAVAGFVVSSAMTPEKTGNEIWMFAVLPEFRGRGEGSRMKNELLAQLHPRVDVFARCPPGAKQYMQMLLRRGFLPQDSAERGMHIFKLPKAGSNAGQHDPQRELAPFVQLTIN
ncbi:MAG: GNAT family N-acetyltransferase [Gammaproteobacteria bacterium]